MQEIEERKNGESATTGMESSQATFRQLMDAIRQGSEDAAWELTDRFSPHILRIVKWSLPKEIRMKVDSLDLLQSVWATLLLKPNKLHVFEDPKQFMGYIAGIAKNKVVDKHRYYSTQKRHVRLELNVSGLKKGAHPPHLESEPGVSNAISTEPSPSQVVMVREKWQRVLKGSSDRDRSIIELRLKGNSYREIASRLRVDERTIQRSVSRMVCEFQE